MKLCLVLKTGVYFVSVFLSGFDSNPYFYATLGGVGGVVSIYNKNDVNSIFSGDKPCPLKSLPCRAWCVSCGHAITALTLLLHRPQVLQASFKQTIFSGIQPRIKLLPGQLLRWCHVNVKALLKARDAGLLVGGSQSGDVGGLFASDGF